MKGSFALLALAGAAIASPLPQGGSSAPAGCQSSVDGTFTITVVNVTQSAKRSLERRQLDGTLTLSLSDGTLTDQAGRTGYIAANDQFQFDNPIQAGALETTGFSVCGNGSLALGSSAIFYQCLSGDFYNLYAQSQGGQCAAIYILTSQGGSGGSPSAAATQSADGQPQVTTQVTQLSDGQPQATTAAAPVSQISDGQPQASTGAAPVTQISDGQPQAATAAPVTQISDGQPQAATGAPVSQIADGQPQAATSGAAVSQIADGQPQAATGAAVTQISDGQPQAATATGAAVSQISDGQPQAATGAAVSQISDGQPQAPTGAAVSQISDGQPQAATGTAQAPATYTGAASRELAGSFALVAGIVGAVAML